MIDIEIATEASGWERSIPELEEVVGRAVDAAVALTSADMGNVQRWDADRGMLLIEAQRGFAQPFLEFSADVADGQASWVRAARCATRVTLENVTTSLIFIGTPALDVMLDAGARAVQSMPLRDSAGQRLGVFSTHWQRPQRPSEKDLRLLALLGRWTAHFLEWKAVRDGKSVGGSCCQDLFSTSLEKTIGRLDDAGERLGS